MKKPLSSIIIAASLSLAALPLVTFTGCKSPPTAAQVATMAQLAQTAADIGASADLQANPSHAPFYLAAVETLNGLESTNNFSPTAFTAALQNLPINQLKSQTATITIDSAVSLWDVYDTQIMNSTNNQEYIEPVLRGVDTGLTQALASAGITNIPSVTQ